VDNVLGFGQDRVNFHQYPGRGTAGQTDPAPTWPNRAGYSIPCAVMVGAGGGELGGGNSPAAREGRVAVRFGREQLCSVGSVLLVCFVYSPFLYRCCCCSLCLLFC